MSAAGRFALGLPLLSSTYQVNVLTSALIAVILGLGLNIIVGLAGMLNLGYAAFTAVGAYGYALLNLHFHLGFWAALPVAGLVAAGFGLALGFPVLRLRGDYLAIVTLGFGEIVRLVLENGVPCTNGPSGIANVPRPGLFGMELGLRGTTLYLYFIALALAAGTAVAVARLKASRIGRAWVALREDETAAETMGIDRTRTKLAALSLGAFFAGVAGVLFRRPDDPRQPRELHVPRVRDGAGDRRARRPRVRRRRRRGRAGAGAAPRVPAAVRAIPDAGLRGGTGADDDPARPARARGRGGRQAQ